MADAYEPIGPMDNVPEAPDEPLPPPPDMPASKANAPAADDVGSKMKSKLSAASAPSKEAVTPSTLQDVEASREKPKKNKKKTNKKKKNKSKMKAMIFLIVGAVLLTLGLILMIVLVAHRAGANMFPALKG